MKIAYYCQHVLGIGHFHRSLEICRVCADRHEVTMIVGGPPISSTTLPFSMLQLPGLKMDEHFHNLTPCDPDAALDEVKQTRRERLLRFCKEYKPDCLIIELYPFGRKAFRFELDPLLETMKAQPHRCRIYCSLRDILVEKREGLETFEQRTVTVLNRFFDGLLIHADQAVIGLDATFGKTAELRAPLFYTGYVTPRPDTRIGQRLRATLKLADDQRLMVVSVGSGSVGDELLEAVVQAVAALSPREKWCVQIFCGPYCRETLFNELRAQQSSLLKVVRFSEEFIHWLGTADLSVSMAGYNTCMNTLAAGVPALMLPFGQNREQRMRLEKLSGMGPLTLLEKDDLAPARLAHLMTKVADTVSAPPSIELDGARRTLEIIEAQQP